MEISVAHFDKNKFYCIFAKANSSKHPIMQKRNSFLVGKAFKAYLLATVLTVAATQIASLVDASLVGQLISAEALGAVNISKPILQLTFSIGNLFIIGGSILTGMAIGNGDHDKANRIFTRCLLTVAIAGAAIVAVGLIWFDQILNLLCNSENLKPQAGEYMRICFITMLPFLLSYMIETYVIVDGSPKLATIAVVISNITNVVLDIIFISVFNWGVEGAASATLIMYVLSALILLVHFRKKNGSRKTLLLDFHGEKGILGQMAIMGLPITITTFLIAVQIAACNIIAIDHLGDVGVVTFAVCITLLAFSMIFVSGTMRTIQPVGAILKGIGDARGILLMMGRAYQFLVVCLVVCSIAIFNFPNQVSAIFGVHDAAMLPKVANALPAFALYIILEGVFSLFIPAYQFYEHNGLAMYIALSKAILPMLGFWAFAVWLPEFVWWGFLAGMIVVGIILLPITANERRKNRLNSPILLIPLQAESEVFDISIPAEVKRINDATDGIVGFAIAKGATTSTANYAALCCEELIKNIAEHSTAHFIDVRALVSDGKVSVSLHDDGKAFNPIETETKDQIGLSLVRKVSSDIKYEYLFNQNMVTVEVAPISTQEA